MSRDGYLPPGCTEKDVDDAAPQNFPGCEICGKPIEPPEEPEWFFVRQGGAPVHGYCKEMYALDGGPEHEPE